MIKVFLVEDEIVMRSGIRNIIPWEREGFSFAGEAGDGELAYPAILKARPDILITDIRMPFMDGLELSERVKRELPDIRIILISGYSDFAYAKEAIRIGVTDYLTKPVTAAGLLETLKHVARKVEEDRRRREMKEQYQKEGEARITLEQQKLFSRILEGGIDGRQIRKEGERLGLDFTASCYQVVLLCVRGLDGEVPNDEDPDGKSPDDESPDGGASDGRAGVDLEARLGTLDRLIVVKRGMDGYMLLLGADAPEEMEARFLALQGVITRLHDTAGIAFFGGVGTVVIRLGEIRDSYQSAARAFSGRFFMEWNRFVSGTDSPDGAGKLFDIRSLGTEALSQKAIVNFLKNGAAGEIDEFVENYYESIGAEHFSSRIFRQYVVMNIAVSLKSFAEEAKIREEFPGMPDADAALLSERIGTKEGFTQFFGGALRMAIALRNRHAKRRYGAVILDAKRFIGEHYDSADLTLQTVAGRVHMSSSYFSTVFSKETGQTFVEYLTFLRMEKAKELLSCTGMKTIDIAFSVGYRDPHYFGYLFKKLIGQTPKEYRMERREKMP